MCRFCCRFSQPCKLVVDSDPIAFFRKERPGFPIAYPQCRAAYLPRRRELAGRWADMLCEGMIEPIALFELPARKTGAHARRRPPPPASADRSGVPLSRAPTRCVRKVCDRDLGV